MTTHARAPSCHPDRRPCRRQPHRSAVCAAAPAQVPVSFPSAARACLPHRQAHRGERAVCCSHHLARRHKCKRQLSRHDKRKHRQTVAAPCCHGDRRCRCGAADGSGQLPGTACRVCLATPPPQLCGANSAARLSRCHCPHPHHMA